MMFAAVLLCVLATAQAADMVDFDLLIDFLKDFGYSNSELTSTFRFDFDSVSSPPDCSRLRKGSDWVDCSSISSNRVSYINLEGKNFGSFAFTEIRGLSRLTRLTELRWESRVSGPFGSTRWTTRLSTLNIVDSAFSGVVPDWVFALPTFSCQLPCGLDRRALPDTQPAIVNDCTLPNNYFDCGFIPGWAELRCGLNATLCYTPTPMPTPEPTPPTPMPTPMPTPGPFDAQVELQPCPDVTQMPPGCLDSTCQWACQLFNCTSSYASNKYSLTSSYSCAQVLGEPTCTANTFCSDAFAPPVGTQTGLLMDVGFLKPVVPQKLGVHLTYRWNFVDYIEAMDSNKKWHTVWTAPMPTMETPNPNELKLLDLNVIPGLISNRIRIVMNSTDDTGEIDAILLLGVDGTIAPTPPMMPTPMPPPTPLPTPAPECEEPTILSAVSTLDNSVGDNFCVGTACQFACVVRECSSASSLFPCSNVLNNELDTHWRAENLGEAQVIDLWYERPVQATGVIVVENSVGTRVSKIEVMDNGTFVAAWEGGFDGLGNRGVEFYALSNVTANLVQRIRVHFDSTRFHEVALIRLIGRLPEMPEQPSMRLNGRFVKTIMKLPVQKTQMLASYNPAPVANGRVYVPPGRTFSNLNAVKQETLERCNFNATNPTCTPFTGSLPDHYFYETNSAAIKFSETENIIMIAGGQGRTSFRYNGNFYVRSTTDSTWREVSSEESRHSGCLVGVDSGTEKAFYYAGGRNPASSPAYQLRGSVERITFPDGVTSGFPELLAEGLSQPRAMIGCSVMGASRRKIMFAGGWFYKSESDGTLEATDVVDIYNTVDGTWTLTKMTHRGVGRSVAALKDFVFVTGGTTVQSEAPTFGTVVVGAVALGSATELGVDRYDDASGEWTYMPRVLTKVSQGTSSVPPQRIAVAFADRFVAVVTAEADFETESFARPIDLLDTTTNSWYNNVLDHHASYGYMAAGVGNRLVVIAGAGTSESFADPHDAVAVFEWQPFDYAFLSCESPENQLDCRSCLYDNQNRTVSPCRWCHDPSQPGKGQCRATSVLCAAPFGDSILAGRQVCPTAPPTPPPPVLIQKRYRLKLNRPFATWEFDSFSMQLASYFNTNAASFTEVFPAVEGSVITWIEHSEMTTREAEFDTMWNNIVDAPGLDVLEVRRVSIAERPGHVDANGNLITTTTVTTTTVTTTTGSNGPPATAATTTSTSAATTDSSAKNVNSGSMDEPSGPPVSILVVIGLMIFLICLVIVIAVACLIVRKRKKTEQASLRNSGSYGNTEMMAGDAPNLESARLDDNYDLASSTYGTPPPESQRSYTNLSGTATLDKKYLIMPEDFTLGRKLGEGAFGVVYKGNWRQIEVAIKEVKASAMTDKQQIESFEREAVKMSQLRPHRNVVTLYGVCQAPLSIVTEFAEGGALDEWLQSSEGKEASVKMLTTIALGSARGIAHLHEENVVHRDLAARNILLTKTLEPKVADFGMSRDTAGQEENQTRTRVGPLKWMAPEQLRKQQYSKMSDVFAFGVVVFEIYSGREPWDTIPNTEACHRVLSGHRLEVPARAPEGIAKLMGDCFQEEPTKRPNMNACCQSLNVIHAQVTDEKKARRKSRKSRKLDASIASSGYDAPDSASVIPVSLATSQAYSLAPEPTSSTNGGYEQAPIVDQDDLFDDDNENKLPEAGGGAYSEPDASLAGSLVGPSASTGTELEKPTTPFAKTTAEEKRMWRLSKKYEPKIEPTVADQPAGERKLPLGWRSAISPKSGRTYYYKKGSKETQWTFPTE